MELKQVYELLEKTENGADAITAIKSEIAKLSAEAKNHRQSSEKAAAKTKSILEGLGLEDGDNVVEKAKEIKTALDAFSKDGKTPSEVAKDMTELTVKVAALTKQWEASENARQAEKEKRFEATKNSALIEALTKGKAAAPKEMAALIAPSLFFDEKEQLMYKDGEKVMSVDDGVKAWLDSNKWAVKIEGNAGGGAPQGMDGAADPFLAGFGK